MKKKILLIILCGVCLLGITGCGKKDSNSNSKSTKTVKAKVVNNEGKTENLTSKDIYKVNESNEAKFKKYYAGAKIEFDGTVESIKVDTIMSNNSCYIGTSFERGESGLENVVESSKNDTRNCATIEFKEGYKLQIPESGIIDVASISEGDKFHVESNIITMWNEQVSCFGYDTDQKAVDFDKTVMKAK